MSITDMRSSKEEKELRKAQAFFGSHKQVTSRARLGMGMPLGCMIPLGILP